MLITSCVAPGKPVMWHFNDLPVEERRWLHGTGSHSTVDGLIAGDFTSIKFEFEIGETPVSADGKLCICWRWPFDWGDLQTEDPQAEGYLSIEHHPLKSGAGGTVTLLPEYHWFGWIEPWHHHVEVSLGSGELKPGDRVVLTLGDQSANSRGWRAATCTTSSMQFLMLIDHDGSQNWSRLVDPPAFPISAGPPVRLLAVAPSTAIVDEPIELAVRAEDRWGNPTSLAGQDVLVQCAGAGGEAVSVEIVPIENECPLVCRFTTQLKQTGTFRLSAKIDAIELQAESNPIRVDAEPPEWSVFWGDVHSGQTEIGCGGGTLADHYTFGRDIAGLQFITHQANDHYVTVDEWVQTRTVTNEFYEPGRYVALLGCEWSPPTRDGGDRNVIYREDDPRLRRSGRYFTEEHNDPEPDIPTAPEFHDAFRDLDVLVNIHVGGRPTNLEWYEPKIEKLAEIHSTHGTSEWFVHDVLSRGYQVGITAGTDGVMGRPGACHPGERLIRNVRNGLTAVYAKELTREALWEAFHARRCYATSGPRILLGFDVDGHMMGTEFETMSAPVMHVDVEGTAAIERIDFLRGAEVISSWQTGWQPVTGDHKQLRILWGGTERRGTARLQRVDWEGSVSVTGGTIQPIETIGFQSPRDGYQCLNEAAIRWTSHTAGNSAGLILNVTGDENTILQFESGPKSFSCSLGQVEQSPMTVSAGGVGRFVSVGPLPRQDSARRVELSYRDTERVEGVFPYWVRVLQVNQERAWSSPVYVTRKNAES